MSSSYYSIKDSYTRKPKSNRLPKFILFLLIVGTFAFAGYYIYLNKDRLLFYFQKDKYLKLQEKLKQTENLLATETNLNSDKVQAIEELLFNLSQDHPDDFLVFFFRGQLYFKLFQQQLQTNSVLYKEIFFMDFLDRYTFPTQLNRRHWHNALISLRKAKALGLSKSYNKKTVEALAVLYLWGGKAYYPSGQQMLSGFQNSKATSLFNIILNKKEPQWHVLEKEFDRDLIKFWQAIYSLRIGNEPKGFSYLKDLTMTNPENPQKNRLLQNNAHYLLGYIMQKQKKWKSQLKNWQSIDFDEFVPRHPWFIKEYNYLLRYLGKNKEASSFLHRYEKVMRN